MKNTIEIASKVLWEHEAIIKNDLSAQFREIVSDFDISHTEMTKDDYLQCLDEELQMLFRNSCQQILESKDIEDCELDDVEDIFEMLGDIIADLSGDFYDIIDDQVNTIFDQAAAAGFLKNTLEKQVQHLTDCLSYEVTCDDKGATIKTNDIHGRVRLISAQDAEDVLKFHIQAVGSKILTHP
ncbi:hypothetical protein [Vibrio parahaemolyticus]|uniref:hypothetical protein n=1 Tax=Vibrio parahaemolyticus TaxID=670 RepID=UPI00041C8E20|nr:hypothetical protein [Vibrio parahaemolyticus]